MSGPTLLARDADSNPSGAQAAHTPYTFDSDLSDIAEELRAVDSAALTAPVAPVANNRASTPQATPAMNPTEGTPVEAAQVSLGQAAAARSGCKSGTGRGQGGKHKNTTAPACEPMTRSKKKTKD